MATPTLQNKTVSDILVLFGLKGFKGITCAANGTTATTLDITVAAGAYAVLVDGTILSQATGELASTSITGLSTNGTYHLFLDATQSPETGVAPSWTVQASAPSANAVKIADVAVASNVVGTITGATQLGTWSF